MDGVIDWSGMPILFAMHDVEDPEAVIRQLIVIRNYCRREKDAG